MNQTDQMDNFLTEEERQRRLILWNSAVIDMRSKEGIDIKVESALKALILVPQMKVVKCTPEELEALEFM